MPQGFSGQVLEQILLGNICDVLGFLVFRKQVIKGLVFRRTYVLRNGIVPLIGAGKFRVDVKDNPAEGINPMPHNLADMILCVPYHFPGFELTNPANA